VCLEVRVILRLVVGVQGVFLVSLLTANVFRGLIVDACAIEVVVCDYNFCSFSAWVLLLSLLSACTLAFCLLYFLCGLLGGGSVLVPCLPRVGFWSLHVCEVDVGFCAVDAYVGPCVEYKNNLFMTNCLEYKLNHYI